MSLFLASNRPFSAIVCGRQNEGCGALIVHLQNIISRVSTKIIVRKNFCFNIWTNHDGKVYCECGLELGLTSSRDQTVHLSNVRQRLFSPFAKFTKSSVDGGSPTSYMYMRGRDPPLVMNQFETERSLDVAGLRGVASTSFGGPNACVSNTSSYFRFDSVFSGTTVYFGYSKC